MKLTYADIRMIINRVSFRDRTFRLLENGDGFLIQVRYHEEDRYTGKIEEQLGREWYVSPWSTETEIVETCFLALQRSNDHVLKEGFTYKGRRVYSPHFFVSARVRLCDEGCDVDQREK